MKRIELKGLRLGYFKGAERVDVELGGQSAAIFGRNSTGKTTLADAYTWLLFEKDSQGRKDFDIKTLVDGKALSGVEHEVEGVFRVDGEELTLRRVYAEKWVKKRGAVTAEFTGHETSHYVDGVPVSKGEYTAKVGEIADEATWRLLSDPGAFQALHWTDRRKVLLEVCGDVSDADVFASNPDLADLPEVLGKHTLDDYRKVVAKRRADLNKEIQELPVRISEVERNLPEAPGVTRKQVESALAGTREERQEASEALVAARTGAGDVTAERKRLREVEDALSDLDRQATRAASDAQDQAHGKVLAAKRALEDADARRQRLQDQASEHESDLQKLDERLGDMRAEWKRVAHQRVEAHVDGTCPTCQQDLPPEQVEEAHRKAVADLNAKKARELGRLQAEGDDLKAKLTAKAAELELTKSKLQALESGRADLEKALKAAEADLATAGQAAPKKDPTQSHAYAKLARERDELTERIERLSSGDAAEIERLTVEVERLDSLIVSLERELAAYQQRETGEARVKELREQERALAAEFQKLERHLWLMDEFTRTKVSLLEEKVANKFEMASFRLFRTLINGGLEECCDTTISGVPYESANHAAQIQAGVDIIRTLQAHYGLKAPLWVDGRESVTDLPEIDTQVISLVVSPSDEQLRVELQEEAEVAA